MRGRPPGVGCSVRQDHIMLALASLSIDLAAVVADKGRGVGLRQPLGLPAATQPRKHFDPLLRSRSIAA